MLYQQTNSGKTVDLLKFPLSSIMLSFILLCNNFRISGVSPDLCFEMLILYFLCDCKRYRIF
jgi:hypothetical protein